MYLNSLYTNNSIAMNTRLCHNTWLILCHLIFKINLIKCSKCIIPWSFKVNLIKPIVHQCKESTIKDSLYLVINLFRIEKPLREIFILKRLITSSKLTQIFKILISWPRLHHSSNSRCRSTINLRILTLIKWCLVNKYNFIKAHPITWISLPKSF